MQKALASRPGKGASKQRNGVGKQGSIREQHDREHNMRIQTGVGKAEYMKHSEAGLGNRGTTWVHCFLPFPCSLWHAVSSLSFAHLSSLLSPLPCPRRLAAFFPSCACSGTLWQWHCSLPFLCLLGNANPSPSFACLSTLLSSPPLTCLGVPLAPLPMPAWARCILTCPCVLASKTKHRTKMRAL